MVFRCAIISSPRRRRRLEPHTWGVTVRGVAREAVEHAERWRRVSVVSATLRLVEVGMYTYRLSVEQRMVERVRRHADIRDRDKLLIAAVLRERFGLWETPGCRVLDLGCGKGGMVEYLLSLGYEAYGCDVSLGWDEQPPALRNRLDLIPESPYRLPYEDERFDVVFTTAVLEHARNTEEVHREIYRVLKPGGVSVHYFPAKWYLPYEPHIRIPLLNWFWPHCPKGWISFWLWLRVLYIPRLGPDRKNILDRYCEFCSQDVIYLSNRAHRQIALRVFGNHHSLMEFYVARAEGGYARLARRLPFRGLTAWFGGNFRMNLVYQQKSD